VTLANPTGRAVALSPCPSYEEFIGLPGAQVSASASYYYLNCQAAPVIPADGSVTFAMRIQVPDGTGLAKFLWQLQATTVARGDVVRLSAPAPSGGSSRAPVARYAPCAASQLSGHTGSSSAGAGNAYSYFFLTNSSASPCTIEGGPSSAVAFGVDGTQLRLSTGTTDGWGSMIGPPVNLEPGQSAQAVTDSVDGGGFCPDTHSYTLGALAIGIGGSGSVRVSFPAGQPLTLFFCGSNRPYLLGFGVPG
jgi:hypothetical protein